MTPLLRYEAITLGAITAAVIVIGDRYSSGQASYFGIPHDASLAPSPSAIIAVICVFGLILGLGVIGSVHQRASIAKWSDHPDQSRAAVVQKSWRAFDSFTGICMLATSITVFQIDTLAGVTWLCVLAAFAWVQFFKNSPVPRRSRAWVALIAFATYLILWAPYYLGVEVARMRESWYYVSELNSVIIQFSEDHHIAMKVDIHNRTIGPSWYYLPVSEIENMPISKAPIGRLTLLQPQPPEMPSK